MARRFRSFFIRLAPELVLATVASHRLTRLPGSSPTFCQQDDRSRHLVLFRSKCPEVDSSSQWRLLDKWYRYYLNDRGDGDARIGGRAAPRAHRGTAAERGPGQDPAHGRLADARAVERPRPHA